MKACNDLEFIDSYWEEAKRVGNRVLEELPQCSQSTVKNKIGCIVEVNFSDLKDSWYPGDILSRKFGKSPTLKILAEKINNMILNGRSDCVKPMLTAIISGRVKHFSKPQKGSNSLPLGFGHFRWNFSAHTLTVTEITRIKEYFKL